MEALKDLELLIQSRYPIIAVRTHEEARLEEILRLIAARLDMRLHVWTVTDGLRRVASENPLYDTRDAGLALANLSSLKGEAIYLFKDLYRMLDDTKIARRLLDLVSTFRQDRRVLVLSGAHYTLPHELQRHVVLFDLQTPSAGELKVAARKLLNDLSREHRFKVTLSSREFDELIESMKGLTLFEAERVLTRALLEDLALTLEDLDAVVRMKKELLDARGVLEYFPPDVGMKEVGGLARLKGWLAKRARAFTPGAKRFGLSPPKGLLLVGVPGCGKSLAAKAVAKEWGLPLLKLEAGRLYDKYVGETDKNLEEAIRLAERLAPCVLMVDEIEKAFSAHGDGAADAGLSQRVLGRFLGWLQDRQAPVFVVATCNRIAGLPPELMRKGRVDEIFFVDLPSELERREIFTVHLERRGRDPAHFQIDRLAALSEGFSGAEIEEAIVSALYTAFSRGTDIDTGLVEAELAATEPLSSIRREEVAALRQWARERAVSAN